MDQSENSTVRIDKWLWAARFFKTRSLAQEALELGRVRENGDRIKSSRQLHTGELLSVTRGEDTMEVLVTGLRGSATDAAKLYEETESSKALRRSRKDILKLAAEPAGSIRGGRPTKREGRKLRNFRNSF